MQEKYDAAIHVILNNLNFLSSSEKLVACAVVHQMAAVDEDAVMISNAKLASLTGLTKSTVIKVKQRLVSKMVLATDTVTGNDGGNYPTVYKNGYYLQGATYIKENCDGMVL